MNECTEFDNKQKKVRWAKLDDGKIKWVTEKQEFLPSNIFLECPCMNPKDADGLSLSAYYDHALNEIGKLWAKKEIKDFPYEQVFNYSKEGFIELLDDYIKGDRDFMSVYLYDMDRFVAEKKYCRYPYDIFVAFLKEFSKILE